MVKPKLISFKICPYVQRSVITLKEKNVDFDIEYIDLANKPEWFLKISPLGRVPVLQVGEEVLFESAVINEYLDGFISDKTFKDEAKDWPNYTTDYKPLLDLAKNNKLEFIATNIPRRYANMVFNRGIKSLDSISTEAKQWICPLPFVYDSNLACYKEISKATGGHGGENLKLSQASKDATMAHFILKNFKTGHTFIHYNGSYHSNNYESIVWYLRQSNPDLDIVTINTIETKDIADFNSASKGSADYIIQIPSSMTKTY